jgi:hypothetical protein
MVPCCQACLCFLTRHTSLASLNQLCLCCLQEHFANDFDAVAAANAGKPVLMTGMCFQPACILACSHSHTPVAHKQHPTPFASLHTPSFVSFSFAISTCVSCAMVSQYASTIAATQLVWCLSVDMTKLSSPTCVCVYTVVGTACSRWWC